MNDYEQQDSPSGKQWTKPLVSVEVECQGTTVRVPATVMFMTQGDADRQQPKEALSGIAEPGEVCAIVVIEDGSAAIAQQMMQAHMGRARQRGSRTTAREMTEAVEALTRACGGSRVLVSMAEDGPNPQATERVMRDVKGEIESLLERLSREGEEER